MADTNDGDIKAEIGVVCYLARKATKAQKELESEEEFKFTKLEYAAIYADGNETPEVWAGPVPALYLWESRLTSGILRGDQSLNHWEREGEGDVVLDDDRITRLSILDHQIHLLRKAKPAAASLPIASTQVREDRSIRSASSHPPPVHRDPSAAAPAKRGNPATDISSATRGTEGNPGALALAASKRKDAIAADPGADVEPVNAVAPVASSSEPASTSSSGCIWQKPFQISSFFVTREMRWSLTKTTMDFPNIFIHCVKLLQERVERSEFPDGRAPYACLPLEFAHEIWNQISREVRSRASYTTIRWEKVFKKSGLPIEEEFRVNMFTSYKAWLMPLQYGALWSLLIYRNGRITYCKSRTSVETEIDLGLTSDLRSSGFELNALPFPGSGSVNSGLSAFLTMMGVVTHPERESITLGWGFRGRQTEICERLEADVERGALSSWQDFYSEIVPGNTDQDDKGNHQDVKTEDDMGSDAATEIIDAADEEDDERR